MTETPGSRPLDDEPAPAPAEAMALLREQQRKVDVALLAPIPWLYGIRGVAWLVGFSLLWSARPGGNPFFLVPAPLAGGVFAMLIVAAIIASAVVGMRINRGVRGASDFQGAVYGISWSLCGLAFAAVGVGLISNGMSPELASIYFPAASSVAPFFGSPTHNLVLAIAGGGTFLVGAAVAQAHLRRKR